MLLTIVSGGQTGADRAALDWAIARGARHRGWCPAGRRAEDGVIDGRYILVETESARYDARTRRNVRDSDATLIVNLGALEGGSLATLRVARRLGKPVCVIQVDEAPSTEQLDSLRDWLRQSRAQALNFAGPRESKRPGTYVATLALLHRLFGAADEDRHG